MSEIDRGLVNIIAWALLLAPILPLTVAALLSPFFGSRNIALRERAGIALRDALLSGVIALLAATFLFGWQLDSVLLFWLTVLAYLSISAPSAIWLVLYLRGRFA
jgi:hypothetical protein